MASTDAGRPATEGAVPPRTDAGEPRLQLTHELLYAFVHAYLADGGKLVKPARIPVGQSLLAVDPRFDLFHFVRSLEATFAVRVDALDFHPENFVSIQAVVRWAERRGLLQAPEATEAFSEPVPSSEGATPAPDGHGAEPAGDVRATWLSFGLLILLCALLAGLHHTGLRLTPLTSTAVGPDVSYAMLVVTGAVHLGVGRRRRFTMLLAAWGMAYAVILNVAFVPLAAYVVAVAGLTRAAWPLRYRLGLAALLWVSLPLARWTLFPRTWMGPTLLLILVWVSLTYPTLLLLVERARGLDPPPGLAADGTYLLALPRLVEPFFQPISPRQFHASARRPLTVSQGMRAFVLGLYGVVLSLLGAWMRRHGHRLPGVALPAMVSWASFYVNLANQIFISVALFRLMGFHLASGFRWPLLSTSFIDFFRRWNHYVRDAVVTAFFFPLAGAFRRHLGRRTLGVVASYGAIALGSYALNDLLVPAMTAEHLSEGARTSLSLPHVLALFLYWTGIVWSAQLGNAPWQMRQTRRMHGAGRVVATVKFLFVFLAIPLAVDPGLPLVMRAWRR